MAVPASCRVSASMRAFFALVFIFAWLTSAQSPTTEADEAAIADPDVECQSYGYAPVSNALSRFPGLNQIATILPNDGAAVAQWNAIQPKIPNIAPKNISLTISIDVGEPNYPKTDPDCWWSFAKCTTPKTQGLPADVTTVPEPQSLGFGFDDGPFCGHNVFYNYLTSQNQKATMYYIGSNVINFPFQAQRAVVDGHEICAHTWSHKYMTSLTSDQAFAELYYTIKLVTGVTVTCWRPPFGDVDDRIRAIAAALGLRTIVWTYDSNDWRVGTGNVTAADADAQYQGLIDAAGNGTFANAGTIILTHELNNFTMSEAIKFYPLLKSAFAHIVPVGVAFNITNPYIEKEYMLPSFAQYASGTTVMGANTINPNNTILPPLVAPLASLSVSPGIQSSSGLPSTSTGGSGSTQTTGATVASPNPTNTGKSAAVTLQVHPASLMILVCIAGWAVYV